MRKVFADTFYFIAVTNPRDRWHMRVWAVEAELGDIRIVTTEEVLIEFLTALSGGGAFLRTRAVQIVRTLYTNPNVVVIPQSSSSFSRGMDFYEQRDDKQYSLTDRISMNALIDEGIGDVLTNDHHFAQESFNVLIPRL